MLKPIDAEKGEGVELAKQYGIIGYPTYIVLNADGQTLDRWIGYDKPSWLKSAASALADPTTIEEKEARYAAHPTAVDAAKLASFHDSKGEAKEAVGLYRKAQELNTDPRVSYLMPIFESTAYGVRKKKLPPEDAARAADDVFKAPGATPGNLLATANMMVYLDSATEGKVDPVPYLKEAVERTADTDDPAVQKDRAGLLPDYALKVEKNPEQAVAYKKAAMPDGWQKDPSQINSFAWWCFENRIDLAEAGALAGTAVDLAEPGATRAMILDTLAEIQNAQGNPSSALATMKKAVQEDPDNAHYQKQVKRFQELSSASGSGSDR